MKSPLCTTGCCALISVPLQVAGSTNFDSRSFALNDEVNVAFPDRSVARRRELDFENDLRSSRRISYEEWKRRPIWERAEERLGWLTEKQE